MDERPRVDQWREEFERLGEQRVRDHMLEGIWGRADGVKCRLAQDWLDEQERVHQKDRLAKADAWAQEQVRIAQEANDLARDANEIARSARFWAAVAACFAIPAAVLAIIALIIS